MSFIDHRCKRCDLPIVMHGGNPKYDHRADGDDEPELIQTYSNGDGGPLGPNAGRPVAHVEVPGSAPSMFTRSIKLCGCGACVALYDELGGEAA